MAPVQVQPLTADQAKKAYAAMHGPDGSNAHTVASGGQSFALHLEDGGALVFTVRAQNGVFWIDGAIGQAAPGGDMTAQGLTFMEAMASAGKFGSIGFATDRAGLVKKAERQGYRVAGWILKKQLGA
jgi:hypothetical protein